MVISSVFNNPNIQLALKERGRWLLRRFIRFNLGRLKQAWKDIPNNEKWKTVRNRYIHNEANKQGLRANPVAIILERKINDR
jgi:hypothetical protein